MKLFDKKKWFDSHIFLIKKDVESKNSKKYKILGICIYIIILYWIPLSDT